MKNERLIKRFLKYVKIDTQSSYESNTYPSTLKQLNLSRILRDELIEMGIDAFLDDYGYVYAKIEKNVDNVKAIGLIAHVDTSPDAPGENVNPRIIEKYDGSLIKLNETYHMEPKTHPDLLECINEDLIVTDGNTLLGADDKCGVAEIMEICQILSENKSIKHGDIFICFTPDEEVGEGTKHFNYDYFNVDFAYTFDGSKVGGIEHENFNAAAALVSFTGISIHPGQSKNKMVNAILVAYEFNSMLDPFLTPSNTEGYEGFNHINSIEGTVESCVCKYIIRNHDMNLFLKQKEDFNKISRYLNEKYSFEVCRVSITDSYYNMNDKISQNPYCVQIAKEAISNCGITPFSTPIRGGTDGARLTENGILTPNLGTGGFHFHGRLEFASINQMKKSVEIGLEIIRLLTVTK